MSRSRRRRPLAQFEHGTRIYAPTDREPRFRVVANDSASGERIFHKLTTEELARSKARELEQFLAHESPIRDAPERGPRTVSRLADLYRADHLSGLSTRFAAKHDSLLRCWILPVIGERTVTGWTPADSAAVLASVRAAGRSDALLQDVGSAMRALVTHARRLRWLTAQSEDPMWMVRYAKSASVQGASALYVPRSSLPTDEQCADLFRAMTGLGHPRWATAMRLVHRSGLRWGELTALTAADLVFEPARSVLIRRAVDVDRTGAPTFKVPKNGRTRTSFFPRSLTGELRDLVDDARSRGGDTALLFPGTRSGIARRAAFQSIWIRAADAAGWKMRRPLQRSNGYGTLGRGWRWTGAAEWTPHDLRHVAACWMLFDLHLDPAIVADRLGHADPGFTLRRYTAIRGDADVVTTTASDSW